MDWPPTSDCVMLITFYIGGFSNTLIKALLQELWIFTTVTDCYSLFCALISGAALLGSFKWGALGYKSQLLFKYWQLYLDEIYMILIFIYNFCICHYWCGVEMAWSLLLPMKQFGHVSWILINIWIIELGPNISFHFLWK